MTTRGLRVLALVVATAASALIASPAQAATAAQGTKAVRFAQAQLGERYVFGATGPSSWDCSGLVQRAWRYAGKRIPRTTYQQLRVGTRVSRRNLRPGDLVFTSRHHVQLYAGRGYIIAAEGNRVVRRKMWGFMTARRP